MFDDEPSIQDPVVVTAPRNSIYPSAWETLGLSPGEYIFGSGYGDLLVDSPLVLDPVLVQGTQSNDTNGDGVENPHVTVGWTGLGGDLFLGQALIGTNGWFDRNGNGFEDDGEEAFNAGQTATAPSDVPLTFQDQIDYFETFTPFSDGLV